MQYARDLAPEQADRFVGMYVNERTLDYGEDGRRAVQLLLQKAYEKNLKKGKVVAGGSTITPMLVPSAVAPPFTSRHLPLLRFTRVYDVGVAAVSPEGPGRVVPRATGVPKFGVPSAFQVNFWARVVRPLSQPSLAESLAW